MLPSEQQQSGKLPQELYRLLDPQASVDLPSAHLVSSRQLDNRELDKLFAALGRNKITWRRALVLHEWLLSMGHTPDDRLCTTLIRVCSQHGQTMTALSLYDWMRSSQRAGGAGLVPTVYTYTAAMRAALTGNIIDRAVKVSGEAAVTAFVGCVLLFGTSVMLAVALRSEGTLSDSYRNRDCSMIVCATMKRCISV